MVRSIQENVKKYGTKKAVNKCVKEQDINVERINPELLL